MFTYHCFHHKTLLFGIVCRDTGTPGTLEPRNSGTQGHRDTGTQATQGHRGPWECAETQQEHPQPFWPELSRLS